MENNYIRLTSYPERRRDWPFDVSAADLYALYIETVPIPASILLGR